MISRNDILNYVKDQYNTEPEYMFKKHPNIAVLRNKESKKWYGVIINVEKRKLGINEDGYTDIINLKGNPEFNSIIKYQNHIISAYHMNKKHWISVLLDYDFNKSELYDLIKWSYELTK